MWEIWGNYLVPKALKVAQSQKNRPIWSHWLLLKSLYGLLMNIARFQLHFQVKQWRMLWQKSARTSGLEKSLSRFVQDWWVHYLSYSILYGMKATVRPDLANFRHFGTIFEVLGKILRACFVSGIRNSKIFTFGQLFILLDDQII